MKEFTVEVISKGLMTCRLPGAVEQRLSERTALGWEIVSVSFGLSLWWIPTAYLTFLKPKQAPVN